MSLRIRRALPWCLGFAAVASPTAVPARAQTPATPPESAARSESTEAREAEHDETAPAPYVFGGYVEAFYQWNFNRPANDITNYRGFDNRHDTFTLANVALDAQWDVADVIGRLTFQVGHTPSTYYLSEPQRAGSSAANASGPELWKYLQQAYVGYRFANVLTVTAGLMLSPIGPEQMAIKDNWNWSRSNLFFGCPFYHTGARATYDLTDSWALTLAAYNGWNSVVDNNRHKSLSTQATYTSRELTLTLLYFGGVERARGAAEGQPWRHLFDAYATWEVAPWLALQAQGNCGFEHNRFGHARWAAAALYARARLAEPLFFALRGDTFSERVPWEASPIFWPAAWVSSGTATLDYRPADHISFRAEYRHDQAQRAMYFGSDLRRDANAAFIPNRREQNTVTIGTTAWF